MVCNKNPDHPKGFYQFCLDIAKTYLGYLS
jgi:hypothetical protein